MTGPKENPTTADAVWEEYMEKTYNVLDWHGWIWLSGKCFSFGLYFVRRMCNV